MVPSKLHCTLESIQSTSTTSIRGEDIEHKFKQILCAKMNVNSTTIDTLVGCIIYKPGTIVDKSMGNISITTPNNSTNQYIFKDDTPTNISLYLSSFALEGLNVQMREC